MSQLKKKKTVGFLVGVIIVVWNNINIFPGKITVDWFYRWFSVSFSTRNSARIDRRSDSSVVSTDNRNISRNSEWIQVLVVIYGVFFFFLTGLGSSERFFVNNGPSSRTDINRIGLLCWGRFSFFSFRLLFLPLIAFVRPNRPNRRPEDRPGPPRRARVKTQRRRPGDADDKGRRPRRFGALFFFFYLDRIP